MHTDVTDPGSAELRTLVDGCLADMGALIDGYLAQLHEIEGYSRVEIPPQDLLDTTSEAIELILRKAAGLPLSARLEGASEAIGRRRAAQGVPLEVLLQAVRMVFRLLWTTLHDRATPTQLRALDQSAVQLWEAIEFHTVRVHAGYLDELSRMRRDRETEISILLSGFLERDRPDPAVTQQVARTLGVVPDGDFVVAAAPLAVLGDIRSRIAAAGTRAVLHAREDTVLILVTDARPPLLESLEWAKGLPLAAAPAVSGLAEVPRAWRIAHDLLVAAARGARGSGGPGPTTLAEGWPALVAAALPELAGAIESDSLGGLAPLTPASREQLIGTVEVYLRSGSLSATAAALFIHRNTVLKRLARFAELTGLDPSTPWNAATIRLALATTAR